MLKTKLFQILSYFFYTTFIHFFPKNIAYVGSYAVFTNYLGKCVLIKISHTTVKEKNNTFLLISIKA